MSDHKLFFVGQKAFIKKGEEVLVVHDPIEGLDYPGGRIEDMDTNLVQSLKREVQEETGLEISVGKPFDTVWHILPSHEKFVGQSVLLVAYECEYVSGEIKLSHEHDKFVWVNKENYHTVNDGTSFFLILEKYFQK
jgi:8-oxo-dGTP pyrophosphatase MutT (NUDIX family)